MFEKMPLRWILAIIALALVIWILASVRRPAEAQQLTPPQALQQALAERFGIDAEIDAIGVAIEAAEAYDRMISLDEPFLVRVDGETRVLTPRMLFEEGVITGGWSAADWPQNARTALALRENDMLYELRFDGRSAIVALSQSGQWIGVLPMLSRDLEEQTLELTNRLSYVEGCSDWHVLTVNIFGRPAEGLRACLHATCQDRTLSQCRVGAVPVFHGWAAELAISPELPVEGLGTGGMCNAMLGYDVSYFMANIPLPIFEFTIGQSLTGAMGATLDCDSNVTLTRR